MTPSPWVNRECSAVGKTQRALWSWLMRRSLWSQVVSSRSCSATSSSGRPAAVGLGAGQALREVDVSVDGIRDQVDRDEAPGAHLGQGIRTATGAVQEPMLPARSRARTRIRYTCPESRPVQIRAVAVVLVATVR